MENILKPETLTLFLYYVVPGFIALQACDVVVPSEKRNFGESVIQLVSYSLITNLLLSFWALPLLAAVNAPKFRTVNPVWFFVINAAYIILALFLLPSILALGTYRLRTVRPGGLRKVFRWVGVEEAILDPMPTAWDKFFAERQSCFIIFHLKNGEMIGGGYSTNSFASAYPAPHQVYVEQLLTVDKETKAFGEVKGSMGGIIKLEDCDYIEMIAPPEESP